MELFPPAQEFQTKAETVTEATELLAAYTAVDVDVVYHLIDADFAAIPALVIGDLSEASFAGYAAKSVALSTFDNVQHEEDGSVRVGSTLLVSWPGPTSGGPVTLYGYYVTDGGAGTRLYRVVHFNEPVVLNDNTQILNLIPILSFTGGYKAE